MKKNIKKISYLGVILLSISFFACNIKTSEKKDEKGVEYTSKYICPMHCDGSGSDSAGTCPVCKMDYVKNKNYEIYICPMHPNEKGEKGDKCSICKMDLEASKN